MNFFGIEGLEDFDFKVLENQSNLKALKISSDKSILDFFKTNNYANLEKLAYLKIKCVLGDEEFLSIQNDVEIYRNFSKKSQSLLSTIKKTILKV